MSQRVMCEALRVQLPLFCPAVESILLSPREHQLSVMGIITQVGGIVEDEKKNQEQEKTFHGSPIFSQKAAVAKHPK